MLSRFESVLFLTLWWQIWINQYIPQNIIGIHFIDKRVSFDHHRRKICGFFRTTIPTLVSGSVSCPWCRIRHSERHRQDYRHYCWFHTVMRRRRRISAYRIHDCCYEKNIFYSGGTRLYLLHAKVVVEIDVLVRDPSLGLQLHLNAIIFFGLTNMKPS